MPGRSLVGKLHVATACFDNKHVPPHKLLAKGGPDHVWISLDHSQIRANRQVR